VIMTAAVAMVVFMMTFVIPTITSVLLDYGGELPLQTKILIGISNFVVRYGLIFFPLLAAAGIALKMFIKRNERARWHFETVMMRFPVVGRIIKEYNIAAITRGLNAPLQSGLSIDRCINLAADACQNLHYRRSLEESIKFVLKGIPLTEALKGYPSLYAPNIIGMLETGESTGKVDHMLGRLAEFYEKSVYETFRNMSSVIEPFLLISLGLVIGFIAVSVLTPIWKFAETI
jgi:type IV pilus assembly protein PilC